MTSLPMMKKRAASWAALTLVSFAGHAADVSIVPAAKTVAIDCHRMVIPDKSFLSVDVSHDQKKGLYVYRYSLRTSDPASPGVNAVLFKDLADNKSPSTFKGARPCMTGRGTAVCSGGTANMVDGVASAITLVSPSPPGIVRYSLIGDVQSGLSDEDFQRLAQQFGGDRDEMLASVDDAMSGSCPYDRAKDVFERGMTGTIVGPSEVRMVNAVFTGPAAEGSTDREVELQSAPSTASRMEDLEQDSIVVTDSRLLPLQVGPSGLEYRKDGTAVVRFTLDAMSGTCNARGVLVRAQLQDGTPVAASVDVEPPACPSQIDQALLVIPSG